MKCDVTNNSNMDMQDLSPLIDDLVSSIQDTMEIESLPAVTLHDDPQNSEDLLGKTAYYDPNNKVITIYVTNRHPKDIMRSIAHEMVHHSQNERGEFDSIGNVGEGYAQADDHLRNMEKEAYLKGNMCFRDWEDGHKKQMMESIHRKNSFKRRTTTMKIHNWKNDELNRLLMEKFGLSEKVGDGSPEKKPGEMTADAKAKSDEQRPDDTIRAAAEKLGINTKGMTPDQIAAALRKEEPTAQQGRNAKRIAAQKEKDAALRKKQKELANQEPQDEACVSDKEDKNLLLSQEETNESFRRRIRTMLDR